MDDDEVARSFKLAFKSAPALHSVKRGDEWWTEIIEKTLSGAGVADSDLQVALPTLAPAIVQRFRTRQAYDVPDDVLPGLEALHQSKLRLGVLTNSDDAIVDALEACGIVGAWIDRRDCFTCVEIGASKPSLPAFAFAARKLGIDLADILHVGDDRGQCVARCTARRLNSAETTTAPLQRACKRCTSIAMRHHRPQALCEGSTSSRNV